MRQRVIEIRKERKIKNKKRGKKKFKSGPTELSLDTIDSRLVFWISLYFLIQRKEEN